jgi:hypothetical protein
MDPTSGENDDYDNQTSMDTDDINDENDNDR